jgi:hypothetical protein
MHPNLIAYLASVEEGTTRILRYPAGRRRRHPSCHAERNGGKIARFLDETRESAMISTSIRRRSRT